MWTPPKYDKFQFAGRKTRAISATYAGHDEWDTTGISFADFGSMHVQRREKTQERRLPTPKWAVNNDELREVVLMHAETRLYIRNHTGTFEERLAAIKAAEELYTQKESVNLTRQTNRYNELMLTGTADEASLDHVAVIVQNIDSNIQVMKRGIVQTSIAIVYHYYRNGFNSVQVAEELGIKPPHVRAWLFRLHEVANAMAAGGKIRTNRYGELGCKALIWPPDKLRHLWVMRANGLTIEQCAAIFGKPTCRIVRAWRKNFGPLNTPTENRRRRIRTVWHDERLAQLRELILAGKNSVECAAELKISAYLVRQARFVYLPDVRFHRPVKPPKPPKLPRVATPKTTTGVERTTKKWTSDRIAQLKHMRDGGTDWFEIARALGLQHPSSASSAYKHFFIRSTYEFKYEAGGEEIQDPKAAGEVSDAEYARMS